MYKIYSSFSFLILLLAANSLFAQKEYFNWYFGYEAGVTFNNAGIKPTGLLDGKLVSDEGCSAISSGNGELLFYTNGVSIWDMNHNHICDNCLRGQISSTQSSLIVKRPGSDSLYYIFTTSAWAEPPYFNYAILDLSLNNGYGSIISQKQINDNCTEKLNAVIHRNKTDVWIVTHEWKSNAFNVYLLTANGLDTIHRKEIGSYHGENLPDYSGQMKFSSNGKKLALVNLGVSRLELFNFDSETGEISNPVKYKADSENSMYGVEFSFDGSKMYFSENNIIYQCDANAKNDQELKNSITEVGVAGPGVENNVRALQIGPDKKIYHTILNNGWLGVINEPEKSGAACDYVEKGVYLKGRQALIGLPNIVQGTYRNFLKAEGSPACAGGEISLDADLQPPSDSCKYEWTGPLGYYSTEKSPVIKNATPEMEGWYIIKTTLYDDEYIDSVYIEIYEIDLSIEGGREFCSGDSLTLRAEPFNSDYTYEWSTGEKAPEITIHKGGSYSVSAVSSFGCKRTETTEIEQYPAPGVEILGGPGICIDSSLTLFSNKDFERYKWSTGDTTKEITINNPGIYYLTVASEFGCNETDTIEVKVYAPELAFDKDSLNFGFTLLDKETGLQLTAYNNGDEEVNFTAYFEEDSIFGTNISSVPMNIKAGAKGSFNVSFAPDNIIDYNTVLIIEVSNPCHQIYRIPASGSGLVEMIVEVPELSSYIGAQPCFPINAKLLTQRNIKTVSDYLANLHFDATVMIKNSDITYYFKNKRFTVEGENVEAGNAPVKIGEFCGLCILGEVDMANLIIDSVFWGDNHVKPVYKNGSLTIKGLCQQSSSRLKMYAGTTMSLSPNPGCEGVKAIIETEETGAFELSVYSAQGKEIESFNWSSSGKTGRILLLSSDKYGQGIYQAVLKTPMTSLSERLIIIK